MGLGVNALFFAFLVVAFAPFYLPAVCLGAILGWRTIDHCYGLRTGQRGYWTAFALLFALAFAYAFAVVFFWTESSDLVGAVAYTVVSISIPGLLLYVHVCSRYRESPRSPSQWLVGALVLAINSLLILTVIKVWMWLAI